MDNAQSHAANDPRWSFDQMPHRPLDPDASPVVGAAKPVRRRRKRHPAARARKIVTGVGITGVVGLATAMGVAAASTPISTTNPGVTADSPPDAGPASGSRSATTNTTVRVPSGSSKRSTTSVVPTSPRSSPTPQGRTSGSR